MQTSTQMYLDQFTVSMDLCGYAEVTKKSYHANLRMYLQFIDKDPKDADYEDVRRYLHHLIKERKLSPEYINVAYSAIKIFYETTLRREWNMKHIPRIKKKLGLPKVLSVEQVKRLLDATVNLKHKAILTVAYSAGLRVNELTHLRVSDIDSKNMRIHVRFGKGGYERTSILSSDALLLLREYWKAYRPKDWLFPGMAEGKPITTTTAERVYKQMLDKAGLGKDSSFHALRHSFATHLLNDNENINTIRELLGHTSLVSTTRYLHLVDAKILNLKSPQDNWTKKPEDENEH